MNVNKLVEEYPNDMELGAKIRELYWEERNHKEAIMKSNENFMIYESPDGGKTVYKRAFGAPTSDRVLVTNQLNLFE